MQRSGRRITSDSATPATTLSSDTNPHTESLQPRWMTTEDFENLEAHKQCAKISTGKNFPDVANDGDVFIHINSSLKERIMKLFTSSTKVLVAGMVVGYALGSMHGWSLAKASK
jgi:hypothetical protein